MMSQIAVGRTPFDDIYNLPDPRGFFGGLGRFDYQTPHHAQTVFRRLVAARARSGPVTVVDLCCSYGINAALLNHHLTLADLYRRYTSPPVAAMDTIELIKSDKDFYAARRREDAVPVVGLDIAGHAIDYALAVGLLDAGFGENLETDTASAALLRAVGSVSLITVTGGASFLTARTYHQLLRTADEPAWVAAFVLRTGSHRHIADALAEHGLTTEVDPEQTIAQRRFTDPDEQRYAIAAVTATGVDPTGKEARGYFHAALHLSRPTGQTTPPYPSLISPTPTIVGYAPNSLG
jgi:hypothetical protein